MGITVEGLRVTAAELGVEIVTDVSLSVPPRTTLGIVGESGCGKTTVAMALLGFARPGTGITAGSVTVGGLDLLSLGENDLRRQRGRVISYVPQNPARALSPGMTVGHQLEEMLDAGASDTERKAALQRAWEGAQLPFTPEMLSRYPHQLSGGQQQRVAIAMALVCEPQVIVMDEPTTGLDVLTQDRLIGVIAGLRERRDVSIVYVSHDLGVVRNLVDSVAVMYGGRVVETGPVNDLFRDPCHPYTRRLLEAIPRVRSDTRFLRGIPGSAVEPWDRPPGCPFAPRCDIRIDRCDAEMPPSEIVRGSAHAAYELLAGRGSGSGRPGHPRRERSTTRSRSVSPRPPILAVKDLVVAYRGKRLGIGKGRQPSVALHGISFSLPAGLVPRGRRRERQWKDNARSLPCGLAPAALGSGAVRGGATRGAWRRIGSRRCGDASSSFSRILTARSTRTCRSARIVRRPLRQFFDLSHAEELARVSELPGTGAPSTEREGPHASRAERRREAARRHRPRPCCGSRAPHLRRSDIGARRSRPGEHPRAPDRAPTRPVALDVVHLTRSRRRAVDQ